MPRAADTVGEQPTWVLVVDDLANRAQFETVGDDRLEDAYQKALDLAIFLRERIEVNRRLQRIGRVG